MTALVPGQPQRRRGGHVCRALAGLVDGLVDVGHLAVDHPDRVAWQRRADSFLAGSARARARG